MAWLQKYQALVRDRFNILWTTKINKQDYYGSVIALTGGAEPLSFEHCAESDDLIEPIKSTRAVLTARSNAMFYFSGLYSVDDMASQVLIYRGANLYFSGYVDPRQYSEPYGPVPYETTIYCVDGLSYLKYFKYEESDGVPYNGLRFKSQIILDILGKIGFTTFKEFVNVYDTNMDSGVGDSPLDQSKLNADRFEDMYCDDVLKIVLKEYFAAIKQVDGVFVIYRPRDQRKATVYGRAFTDATTKTATSMEPQQFINRPETPSALRQVPGGNTGIQRPAKKITIKQDYGLKDSWLDNWEFIADTFDGDTFRDWINNFSLPVMPCSSIIASEETGFFIDIEDADGASYLSQEFGANAVVPDDGSDQLSVELKYMFYNTTVNTISSVSFFFRIYSLASGRYLELTSGTEGTEASWHLSTTVMSIYITEADIAPGATEWTTWLRQITDGLPDTGPFKILFYPGSNTEAIYIGIKDVKIGVTSGAMSVMTKTTKAVATHRTAPSNYVQFMKSVSFVIAEITENVIEKTNDISGEEKEYSLEVGDVTDSNIDNVIEQFAGAISVYKDGENIPSTLWNSRGGSESKPLLEILADDLAEHYARPKQLLDLIIMEMNLEETPVAYPYTSGFIAWTTVVFNTFALSGINITSGISTSGAAYAMMNEVTLAIGDKITVTVTLTLNSGVAPYIVLWDDTNDEAASEIFTLEEGVNEIDMISTCEGPVRLLLEVANNSNFSTSDTSIEQYEIIQENEEGMSPLNFIGSFQDVINKREYASLFDTWLNGDFATFEFTLLDITSAISTAGSAYATMNAVTLKEGDVITITLTLTLISGAAPTIALWDSANTEAVSEEIQLGEGINEISLTSTYTGSVIILLQVANNSSFSTSHTYIEQHAIRCFVANRGTFYVKKRTWKLDLHEIEEPETAAIEGEIPDNVLLNDDGSPILNDDGSYIYTS